ncbi:MAG: tRNA (N(6)-L-threonylcarbamoyladenosine(37)-C(2))-methylthiotransferase MtaB, partial [Nonlabens sp.]
KEGFIHGFTENYVKVKTYWNPEYVNQLHDVKLLSIEEDGLVRIELID